MILSLTPPPPPPNLLPCTKLKYMDRERKKHPDNKSWKSASHYVTKREPRPFAWEDRPNWSTWREREKNTLTSPENQHHIMWLRGYPDLLHQRVDQAEVHGEKKETHTLTTSPENQHHMYQRWKNLFLHRRPTTSFQPPLEPWVFLGEWEWDWLVGLINKVSYYNQYNF